MSKNLRIAIYAFTVICLIITWYWGAKIIQDNQPKDSGLGYYSQDTTTAHLYKVANFSFMNQDSQMISRENYENKVWVTDFFFTTCKGICPIMSSNLAEVNKEYAQDSHVMFLSHTVDPQYDNVKVLNEYAGRHDAVGGKWNFVTGNEKDIYHLARTSYFVATPKDSTYEEDFVHSQLMCLVDPHLHVRGFYDGTVKADMEKLIEDIDKLKYEYELK